MLQASSAFDIQNHRAYDTLSQTRAWSGNGQLQVSNPATQLEDRTPVVEVEALLYARTEIYFEGG
jgi:hypothetical protein